MRSSRRGSPCLTASRTPSSMARAAMPSLVNLRVGEQGAAEVEVLVEAIQGLQVMSHLRELDAAGEAPKLKEKLLNRSTRPVLMTQMKKSKAPPRNEDESLPKNLLTSTSQNPQRKFFKIPISVKYIVSMK